VESNKNPKKRIAYKYSFEAGQKKVQLELENLELARIDHQNNTHRAQSW